MAYVRKTRDEYQVHVCYSSQYGYEEVTSADTYKEARAYLKDYRTNAPEYPAKIVIKRIRKEGEGV